MADFGSYIRIGTRAAQPAATTVAVGTLYSVSDEGNTVERSNGSAWVAYAPAAGGDVDGPAASVASEIVLFDGTSGKLLKRASNTGLLKAASGVIATATAGTDYVAPGVLLGMQVITTTGAGTYTPTAGTASIVIELVGAGGGGAGADGASGNNAVGMSGGGGAYLLKRLTADFSGASYSVGAKGTGGVSTNGTGNDGGDTTFTDTAGSPTTYTAAGGTGGTTGGPSTNFIRPGEATDGAGGVATNGDLNVTGGFAGSSISLANGFATSGEGGSSQFARGARATAIGGINTSVAGVNADGKGGGGSGAVCSGTATAQAGGDGSDGVIIIWEFK